MRKIDTAKIVQAVAKLCIDANYCIGGDIADAFRAARAVETRPLARDVLSQLMENAEIAAEGKLPLCQDTGMAVVFVELGQNVQITGGGLPRRSRRACGVGTTRDISGNPSSRTRFVVRTRGTIRRRSSTTMSFRGTDCGSSWPRRDSEARI